jgi:polysaccharide export outer membrane protein
MLNVLGAGADSKLAAETITVDRTADSDVRGERPFLRAPCFKPKGPDRSRTVFVPTFPVPQFHFLVSIVCIGLFSPILAQQAEQPDAPEAYILNADDEIAIRAPDAEEINEKSVRIDRRGNINLPMVGRIKAGGLTPEQLEVEVVQRLKKYIRNPEVSVTIKEFRSQPVSVLGAVTTPGILQVQGHKTLFEVLSMAGGLKPDAGHTIKITRIKQWGAIPLPTAKDDPTGRFSVADVSVRSVMQATNPQENVRIFPNDVISVPKADIVYVVGAVRKAGGFTLNEHETLSILQALSLAEGLDRLAAPKSAKILRAEPDSGSRVKIPVNLKNVLAGRSDDVPLRPGDVLFVPYNATKSALTRTAEAALQIGTGIVIYRR